MVFKGPIKEVIRHSCLARSISFGINCLPCTPLVVENFWRNYFSVSITIVARWILCLVHQKSILFSGPSWWKGPLALPTTSKSRLSLHFLSSLSLSLGSEDYHKKCSICVTILRSVVTIDFHQLKKVVYFCLIVQNKQHFSYLSRVSMWKLSHV